jgi:hypothetical protein
MLSQRQRAAPDQQQQQQALEIAYQNYIDQKAYPYKQLGFMSDILRGVPISGGSTSVYQAPPSTANQLMGYGLGAYGLNKVFNSAEGGSIKGYKKGGVVKNDAGLAELALHQVMGGMQ